MFHSLQEQVPLGHKNSTRKPSNKRVDVIHLREICECRFRRVSRRKIERLNNPAHNDDQRINAPCTDLWYVVEGGDWTLHAQAKSGIENFHPKEVKAVMYSIQKYELHSTCK